VTTKKGDEFSIRNYTSVVAPAKSIATIEALLLKAGTTYVAKMYADRQVSGFIFKLPVEGREVMFKMPCQVSEVEAILMKGISTYAANFARRKAEIHDQALRTAWKLLAEWVHLQLSMIALKQVEPLQAFLSFAYDPGTGTTYFEDLKRDQFRALPAAEAATDGEFTVAV
jgi:hypothetical protein